jgi:drug/metabolite transporter (DMT)-like permease
LLWVVATLIAAAGQTARNAMQSSLVITLGTLGATQVRFLYGLPFALLFLGGVTLAQHASVPEANTRFLLIVFAAGIAQIGGTACLLAAMRRRSFSVATAFSKTEAVQTAAFGLALLGDALTPLRALAIFVASAGVVLIAVKPGDKWDREALAPALFGLASGALFAVASVGYRAAILALGDDMNYLLGATTTLAWTLALQSLSLGAWLLIFQPRALLGSFQVWKRSLFAGFMGAFASCFWFIGFALTSAANVRTLGLVDVIFAQIVSRRVFAEKISARELAGMALIVIGAALLVAFH